MLFRPGYRWLQLTRRLFHIMPEKDYAAAVAALNTLQSNAATLAQVRRSDGNRHSIPDMLQWISKMDYKPSDFQVLNPIHISGTKGKGSTSAFVSSILSQYVQAEPASSKLHKIGLFTSPHLRFVRERIQIDGEPLSETLFSKYFFEVWDKLSGVGDGTKPSYFRFLTVMCLHVFLREKVDTAVIECGIGGEYDCTNIFEKPTVTAVTALGIDHEAVLGSTIQEIAWHKAGIFRPGVPALTAPQRDAAMEVLKSRAEERDTTLTVIGRQRQIETGEARLGLAADFQKTNASLAVAVAAAHLAKIGFPNIPDLLHDAQASLPDKFRKGLELVKWPGRCEIRHEARSNIAWCLDGGHTEESLRLAAGWFAGEVLARNSPKPRFLIFNQQTRNAAPLARSLFTTLAETLNSRHPFTHVIFTTNVTYRETGYTPELSALNILAKPVDELRVQNELAQVWKDRDPDATITVSRSIQEAIESVRMVAGQVDTSSKDETLVLATGSLHLVGGVLEVLESDS
jgi:folylpolyglutamate synthase